MSPECKEVLEQLGGYFLEERGFVEMKVGNLSFSASLSDNLRFFHLIASLRFVMKLFISIPGQGEYPNLFPKRTRRV